MAVSSEKKASIKHNGLEVCFEDKGHVYRVFDKDQQLKYKPISVTTLIHKYQKPFDLEGMSMLSLRQEGGRDAAGDKGQVGEDKQDRLQARHEDALRG